MKKILSALMAIVMIFTITVPAFAAENTATTSTDYNGNPVIIVRGIESENYSCLQRMQTA